ncbi:MAG: hypothetical protein RL398_2688 [Planctomycetota bacterium]
MSSLRAALLPSLLLATACSGGGGSNPVGGSDPTPELLVGRARIDSPYQFAEVALRTSRNLGTRRIGDRSGTERQARIHPDGNRVVFARERSPSSPSSTELFVSTIDGSAAELRLTQNTSYDGWPCWSPDGSSVLFVSDRDGARGLWRCDADGGNAVRLLSPPSGELDDQPDWARNGGRIAFVRRDATGVHRIHVAEAAGTGVFALTDGGPGATSGLGDFAPRFSSDGSTLVFVRRAASDSTALCTVVVASGTVTPQFATVGTIDYPTFAAAGDRWFFGLAEPTQGRDELRLAWLQSGASAATLAWPDRRWRLEGCDVLPNAPALPTAAAPIDLAIESAQLQLAYGTPTAGDRADLRSTDGEEVRVRTASADGRQVAGISLRLDLPTDDAENVAYFDVEIAARALRAGAGCYLRASLYNPVDERFDTVVEREVSDTNLRTLSFRTDSLRHVTRERQIRFTVIADLPPGESSELAVDYVAVRTAMRDNPQ